MQNHNLLYALLALSLVSIGCIAAMVILASNEKEIPPALTALAGVIGAALAVLAGRIPRPPNGHEVTATQK